MLASTKVKIFLTCWILYSLHFATNVVREHYPAFSLAEHGTLQVDEYYGFHPDIFRHTDGHCYINNNVGCSVIGAIPLLIFDPVLDKLEDIGKQKVAARGAQKNLDTTYRTKYPMRRKFFKLVKERGLELRFGASTALTSVLVMAPLSALMVVLMYHILLLRGVGRTRAIWLALLFAFGTPVFFRTAYLNHNMMVMYAVFIAFYLLWRQLDGDSAPKPRVLLIAGFFAGSTLFFDYSGVIPLLTLYGYLFFSRVTKGSPVNAFRESLPFVIGAVPPVLFLLYTQWTMFGNPILPAQYWMPKVNFTDRGWRGMDLPALDLYISNLFSNEYGMFTFGPLLITAFFPIRFYRQERFILPRKERRFVFVFFILFLTFCAANQYSRMQFNTGFRFLAPLVPLLYLAASDHLNRLSGKWLTLISVPTIFHSWVLSMVREPVIDSWRQFLREGIMFPWLRVLKLTNPPDHPILSSPFLPLSILLFCAILIFGIWRFGGVRGMSTTSENVPR